HPSPRPARHARIPANRAHTLATGHPRYDVGQLVQLAAERGDKDELRRLADAGSKDAVDQLVELAQERNDVDELRRLAGIGNQDAADILTEMAEDADEDTA